MSKLAASLFWVTSEDTTTNWFVIASSLKAALDLHALETGSKVLRRNGYLVLGLRTFTISLVSTPRYASLDDLRTLGFQVVQEQPRAVRLGNAWFVEGDAYNQVPEWNAYIEKIVENGSLNKLIG